MKRFSLLLLAVALFGSSCGLAAAAQTHASPAPSLGGKPVPVPPEPHPPGDIPDTQVFISYRSPLGFALKVPEGWSRQLTPGGVRFSSTFGGVSVEIAPSPSAPTMTSVKAKQVSVLEASPAAVRISKIASADLPAGRAILISFGSNSDPNAVTGKAIRLENEQYLLWKRGRLATLTLSAPYGADNGDQWQLIARSFQW